MKYIAKHYPSKSTISLPPLSKVRCCRPKKFGRLPEGLLPIRTNPPKTALSHPLFVERASVCACTASYLHYPPRFSCCNRLYALICFRIRTILLAFRRVSVCVCLYSFVFALSLSLFVGRASVCACMVSHPHYPLLSTTSLPLNERFVGFASLQSLWAFNFGHPCPPSKKGEVLLLGQAEPTMVGIAPYPHHQ